MVTRVTITLLLMIFACRALDAQEIISIQSKGSRADWQLQLLYGDFIQNGIDMYKVTYTTPDLQGVLDTASGLLVVPVREETSVYPTLVYQHGTVNGPSDVPSNLNGGWELAAITGGMGYVTLAPDYLGLGESRGFHPYVHAATEASAALDMLRAVQAYAPEMELYLNEQLFLTGYSQGGHASMALHRAIELEQADEFTVTAAAHLSGPYSISGVMRSLIIGDEPYNYVAYLPNTFLSYNEAYGLYDSLQQVFKPAYAGPIESYYQGQIGLFTLNLQLINMLEADYGSSISRGMLQDSIVEVLTNQPDHPMNQALRDNDVYEWAPQEPTRIFYCMADDQVPFRNSVVADSVMQHLGAADLLALDVNSSFDHGQCVEPAMLQTIIFFGQFQEITVDAGEEAMAPSAILYPNPTDGPLQISRLPRPAEARLYDLRGQLLHRQLLPAGDSTLSLEGLHAGTYLLTLNGDGIRMHEKVVVRP